MQQLNEMTREQLENGLLGFRWRALMRRGGLEPRPQELRGARGMETLNFEQECDRFEQFCRELNSR